ncbi:FtsX-like permease family protein [Pedobacter sp. KBS0701]|uniref:ABC transporter permease n=1 Tax=Pedobacter sp. KBS0701 TaxID=2578106 RepID=UPI00110F35EA|nr:FtsX-like permease family protein [Pedobacter sp. KBS0701]QDW24450.1 FtsX-like permease family protein [Pedobacter sp. KBS0701]
MLKNYFKIALAVLKRRKFFTFISLFGISFTLTILMVVTALADKMISPDYPDYKRERSLYIERIEIKNSKEGWMNSSNVSVYFLEHYVATLKNLQKMAITSGSKSSNAYVNNKKLVIGYQYTNADYWNVLEYKFLEGKAFSQKEIDNAELVAVISKETKEAYFGDEKFVVGKFISADNINYRVIGVVENVSETVRNFNGDMYLPYSIAKENRNNTDVMGAYNAVLLAKSKADIPKLEKEFKQMIKKVPIPKDFDKLYCNADPFFTSVSRRIGGDSTNGAVAKVIILAGGFILLFLLLPTINLVNINITRIMERSSEIGVRKAFGASSKTLVYQFIVENMILTFLGGFIGIILSLIVIALINESDFLSNMRLTMNFAVLFYSFLACVFFGLISGVYPAWRMSKLNVVKALKA